MKPEFLKNLKVGDQGLPQEVVDAILAEHQRIVAANTTEITSLKDQLQTEQANMGFDRKMIIRIIDHTGSKKVPALKYRNVSICAVLTI
jgi:hypothetical protein